MWNPELASFIGITLGDVIISIVYLIFAFMKSNNPDEFLRRMHPLVVFIVFRTSTNYYFGIYVAGILLILSSLIVLHFPESIEFSKFFTTMASLIIFSATFYYLYPKNLLGKQTVPLEPPMIPFGLIGMFLIIVFTLYSSVYARKHNEYRRNFRLGIAYSAYLGVIIFIAYFTDNISHLIYGFAIMIFAIILSFVNHGREVNNLVFLSGFLLALDDIIGYNKYPQYAPFSRTTNLLLAPIFFIILTIAFIIFNRETCKLKELLRSIKPLK